MDTNKRFAKMLKDGGMTRKEASYLLAASVTQNGRTPTVDSWLASPSSRAHRTMPTAKLKLFELLVESKDDD